MEEKVRDSFKGMGGWINGCDKQQDSSTKKEKRKNHSKEVLI